MAKSVSPNGAHRKTSSTKPAVLGINRRSMAARNKSRNPCQRCKKRKHGCTFEDGANQCNNCKQIHAICVRPPATKTPASTSKSSMPLPNITSTGPQQMVSPNHHGGLRFILSDLSVGTCPPEVIAQQSYGPRTLSSYDRPLSHTGQQTMPTRYIDPRKSISSSHGQHQNGMSIAVHPTSPRQSAQMMGNLQVFHEDANSGGYLDTATASTGPPSRKDFYFPTTQPLDYMPASFYGYSPGTVGVGTCPTVGSAHGFSPYPAGSTGYNPPPLAWTGTNNLCFSNQEYPNAFFNHGGGYIGMYGDASRIATGHTDQFSYWPRFL